MTAEQTAQLLQDLVRIPSVNPVGDPGTAPRNTGEAQLAGYVADFLRKLALDVEVHEVLPGRPNVVGKFISRDRRHHLAFAPHTDTVSVTGMTVDPFGGAIRDGRLYGRGACDAKGSLAVFLAALANLVRQKDFRAGAVDVTLAAVMGEETGNFGARALAATDFHPDLLIAGEPTGGRVVHAHKGAAWLTVTTRGRTAHGSTPELGQNAIASMTEVLRRLLGDYAANLQRRPDPVLGCATINMGVIRGGSATNIVAGDCALQVDRRLLPGETAETVLAELRALLADIPAEVQVDGLWCGPLLTPADNPLVQEFARATELPEPLARAMWFCDAGIFAARGIPAVAFGPGSIAQAHTPDEFIELAQVERAAAVTERFLAGLARR
jgi:acetylornithine deacetylase/succinyl-diaminopimelate desuccinylase family protein